MHIEDMRVNEVWQWLADHYPNLEDYLMALDDERAEVSQQLMEAALAETRRRWGEGILKLVEEAK